MNLNIKNNVKTVIFPNGYDENSSFQSYAELNVIGNKIINSLLKKRKKNKQLIEDQLVFYTDAKNQKTGFLSTVYGCTGLLSLMNRYKVELNQDHKNFLKSSIVYLLDYVQENKYTLDPYISDSLNEEIFVNSRDYIGAMTWMLSLLTSVRAAINNDVLVFENNDDINEKLCREIRYIIKNFARNVSGPNSDDPKGWGFTQGAEPSLFFTYSVLEAYSDFEDNICPPCPVGKDESEWREKEWDNELLNYLDYYGDDEDSNSDFVDWKKKCENVAMKVWKKYKNVLKTDFVSDTFWDANTVITKSDILKSNSSNALFNNIYLVFILIFGYVNKRVETESEQEDVIMTMNAALQNVQRIYEQLKKEGYSYIVDNYIIQFGKCKGISTDAIGRLNYEMIIDAKITPTLVKANNMIAFYITQYPVKEMGTLFEELFANIDNNDWVWDRNAYDVKTTERYIEAIADFYLYYDEYEKRYVRRIMQDKEYEKNLANKMRDDIRADVEREIRLELDTIHEEEIKSIKKSFAIENAIVNKIESILADTLERIVLSKNDETVILNEFEEKISNSIKNIFRSENKSINN